MEQKHFLGEKVKVIVEGEIREVYIGYDEINHCDIVRYKVSSPTGTLMGVSDVSLEKIDG